MYDLNDVKGVTFCLVIVAAWICVEETGRLARMREVSGAVVGVEVDKFVEADHHVAVDVGVEESPLCRLRKHAVVEMRVEMAKHALKGTIVEAPVRAGILAEERL